MNENEYVTPLVKKLASQHGVELASLKGTGVGGRIRKQDVLNAAGVRPVVSLPPRPLASVSGGKSLVDERRSTWNSTVKVKVNVYALNPLVDDARQATPANYAAATGEGSAPTLFASGDLPVWLASGAAPSVLLNLPWWARHAAASAGGPQLHAMLERYAGADGVIEAELDHAHDSGNAEYRSRVSNWLSGVGAQGAFNKNPSPARQAAADELYDSLYGAGDAFKATEKARLEEDRAAKAKFDQEQRARNQARRGRS